MHPSLVRSLLLAAAALWLPRGAQALSELYLIDPTQSFVTIAAGSGATLDFGGGPIDLPFRTQVGEVTGVSGNVLPGIGLSNGSRRACSVSSRSTTTTTSGFASSWAAPT
jgi:hypothetical protein